MQSKTVPLRCSFFTLKTKLKSSMPFLEVIVEGKNAPNKKMTSFFNEMINVYNLL